VRKGLSVLKQCIPARASLTILAYAQVRGDNGVLTAEVTDLDVWGVWEEGGYAGVPLNCCLPLARLIAVVEDEVPRFQCGEKAEAVVVESSGIMEELYSWPVDEFPARPDRGEIVARIPGAAFAQALGKVAYDIGLGCTRECLNGLQITVRDGWTVLAASDGSRLAVSCCGGEGKAEAVVPRKAILALQAALEAAPTDSVNVWWWEKPVGDSTSSYVWFQAGPWKIGARLLDGDHFPDWKDVVVSKPVKGTEPSPWYQVTCDRKAMIKAMTSVGRYSVGDKNDGGNVMVKVLWGREEIKLSASSVERGSGKAVVACQRSEAGEEIEMGLNWRSCVDALRVMETKEVGFVIKAARRPVHFVEDGCVIGVVMPMRMEGM